jgi:hypothetical protein
MPLAHVGSGSGPAAELLLLAFALLFLGIVFFFQRSVKPAVSVALVLGALALAGGAFALGGPARPADAAVSIVSPADGTTVPADERLLLEVAVHGVEDYHLHVYVDGRLDSMPQAGAATVELEPGRHTITVELADQDHAPFDPPLKDSVEVIAE